jgi:hypothetical protein
MTDKKVDAEPNVGLQASVTQGIPDMTVVVAEGATVGHLGVSYGPGDEVTLEGPTALSLVQGGHATIKE